MATIMLTPIQTKDQKEVQEVRLNRQLDALGSSEVADRFEVQLDYLVDLIATEQLELKNESRSSTSDTILRCDTAARAEVATKYSVIVCCRDQGARISEHLQKISQVLKQIEGRNEIIFVDAAQHAASVGVCASLGVKLVVSPSRNLGMMRAVGARAATGEFMAFADLGSLETIHQLPEHAKYLSRGCDMVQSMLPGRTLVSSVETDPSASFSANVRNVTHRLTSMMGQRVLAFLGSVISGVSNCGLQPGLQSIRRSSWDSYRMCETGNSTVIEMPLRCHWMQGEMVQLPATKNGNATAPTTLRSCWTRFCQMLGLTIVQRPDRAVMVPALIAVAGSLACMVWTLFCGRLLGTTSAMVWTGSACVATIVSMMWLLAGCISMEYARQRGWLKSQVGRFMNLSAMTAKRLVIAGTAISVLGTFLMLVGSYASGISTADFSRNSREFLTLIQWMWIGATFTVLGHQISIGGMMLSWIRRQAIR